MATKMRCKFGGDECVLRAYRLTDGWVQGIWMQDIGSVFSLCLLVAALLLAVLAAFVAVQRPRTTRLRRLWMIVICVLAALAVWDAWDRVEFTWTIALRNVVTAAGLIGLVQLLPCAAHAKSSGSGVAAVSRGRQGTVWPRAIAALLLAVLLTYAHAGDRLIELWHGEGGYLVFGESYRKLEMIPLSQPVAVTDAGRTIPLYDARVEPRLSVEEEQVLKSFAGRMIVLQPQLNPRANCHGWVFSAGKYWIQNADVAAILDDNQYHQVRVPHAGDLAVYRRNDGRVAHTGLVKAVGNDYVLVESKWGCVGVYLHTPADHPYGGRCEYYRSGRMGHLLRGLAARDGH